MVKKKDLEAALEGETKRAVKAEARLAKAEDEIQQLRSELNAWGTHVCDLEDASPSTLLTLLKTRIDDAVTAAQDPSDKWSLIIIRKGLKALGG